MADRRGKTGPNRGPKANPKGAIQDWLTLVDPDGAFLTTTELSAAFPHGFEPMPADLRTGLRARAADLTDDATERAANRKWLLETVLDWGDQLTEGQGIPATTAVSAAEHGVQLRPEQVLLDVEDANRVRLGVFTWPLGTRLDRRADVTATGDTWPASPIQRAETWCRESGIPLALVTDDDQWALVWAPRGAPAASCRWRVGDLADEKILQAGFVSLLGARRFFAVSDSEGTGETLERLFERAADAEAEVTKGLGTSVRRSVELLVAAISRDNVATDGLVLEGISAIEVYESAVTVLMRLVFLLFAEERRLLPAEDLLGITEMEQLRWLHLDPAERRGERGFESLAIDLRLKEAVDLSRYLQGLSVVTVRDATEKQRLHDELRALLTDLSVVADAIVGAALSTAGKGSINLEQRLDTQLERIRAALDEQRPQVEREAALSVLRAVADGWLRTDLPDDVPSPLDRQCFHWPLQFPEVFLENQRAGFDAIVGNPPFLGGQRITGAMGVSYREYLVQYLAGGAKGSADLVAYFILRMCGISDEVSTLATNTISQGDSREVALGPLLERGWTIHRAVKSEPWPNEANLEIAKLSISRRVWVGSRWLGGVAVGGISASLERPGRVSGSPERLTANSRRSYIGSYVLGLGFVITPQEAEDLIQNDPRNEEVLFPYLNGKDLNDDPAQEASRWVINFRDWPIERARQYPDCFRIVERLVKPERASNPDRSRREMWWRFTRPVADLYSAMEQLDRVIAIVLHSPNALPLLVSKAQVFSHALAVITYDDDGHFGLLTSGFHWWWSVAQSGTLGGESNIRYNPSRAFETFPQPEKQSGTTWEVIDTAGRDLNEFRTDLMARTALGLTKTCNRIHDPNDQDDAVRRLRELHVKLDHAVRDAYGWGDLSLDHHHWQTPQGMRFTVSLKAKDELLDRLLELNHARYAAEAAAGLHDKRAKRSTAKRGAKSADLSQERLL